MRVILLASLILSTLCGAPHRVLYITHSAGFRHESIPVSVDALRDIGARTGRFELVATEDLTELNAETLQTFDAVLFFTSGELPLQDFQKAALLDFVRRGGGFAGFHSATDTLYSWSEYGELIGGYFDGHPWAQEARVNIEDPDHPATRALKSPLTLTEEFYQFRDFSRDRVRVLMTLDVTSVDLMAAGAHTGTRDFPLAWASTFGTGRVFYSALGHFDATWKKPEVQSILDGALAWILRDVDGTAEPRPPVHPRIAEHGVGNAATLNPRDTISPGSLITIFGADLTEGAVMSSTPPAYSRGLAGTTVSLDGIPLDLLYAGPGQINAMAPVSLSPESRTARLQIFTPRSSAEATVTIAGTSPGIFTTSSMADSVITVWATGLGSTFEGFEASIGGFPAKVLYAGFAPGLPGLVQVNLEIAREVPRGLQRIELRPAAGPPVSTEASLPAVQQNSVNP